MVIYLRPLLPAASSNLPGGVTERAAPCLKGFLLLGLAPGGVCRATPVASRAVSSYLTLSPLPVPLRVIGGLLSVALSRRCRRWMLSSTPLCGARTFLSF